MKFYGEFDETLQVETIRGEHLKAYEADLAKRLSTAKQAAKNLDNSMSAYSWLSYIGCLILAIAGIVSGGNWLLIGTAVGIALITWIVGAFAYLHSTKLRLAAAVAEV